MGGEAQHLLKGARTVFSRDGDHELLFIVIGAEKSDLFKRVLA